MAATERLICSSDAVVERGRGVRFELPWQDKATPAFVMRHEGSVRAYLNRCGHVPVQLDWQPGEFFDYSRIYLICATHGALYAPENGQCVSGRCEGRGLQPLPVVERDGHIYLIEQTD